MINRSSGVLASISSLPSEFAIGCFTKDACDFSSLISTMGFRWWQVLPITAIGEDFSPYNGVSFYAGNSLYINPYDLFERGLISDEDLQSAKNQGNIYTVDYPQAKTNSERLLRKAHAAANQILRKDVSSFYEENSGWLLDYARYMVLAEDYGNNWFEWPAEYKTRKAKTMKVFDANNADRLDYYYFEQFIFYSQWQQLKESAHNFGVSIVGELPFYTRYNNVEVWCKPEEFMLDKQFKIVMQGGYCPDPVFPNGRLTGAPSYNFEVMALNGYETFIARIKHCMKLYDALVLEHAKGYAGFWSAKIDALSAIEGGFTPPAGKELTKLLKQAAAGRTLISSDVIINTRAQASLLKSLKMLHSKVFQFIEYPEGQSQYPHNYDDGTAAYSSIRNSRTALGWLYSLSSQRREEFLKYVGYEGFGWGAGGAECTSVGAIVKSMMASAARLVVVPIQDLCGFGDNTRLETATNKSDGNWMFRLYYAAIQNINRPYYAELNNIYFRNNAHRG